MPLVSVVVPIYNVERYLADCLESLAQQTHRELDVVMVDDGSTDSSADIARRFAERDERFRLVQQPNGGLGHARNTGAEHVRGDYIAFVDSDDVVVSNAYELLVGSLEDTGSDIASGNYHRLTATGTWQSAMVASTFTATRLKTHVRKHHALLNDRTAWNKVFRRSFWTQHGFRWPEGVLYEDIPVTLPAHVLARSVDVLRQPIYLWRARVGDSTSITQRRTEPRAVRDRTRAVDGVSRFLAEHGEKDLKRSYDRSVAEQDLRYFLITLDQADDDFRALFLDLVNDYFDRAEPDVFDGLPAIYRLQWHLVRRRLMPELLEVLRFEKSGEIQATPVIRKGRRFWADYPFRGDPALGIPDSVYRLDRDELPLRGSIEDVRWSGDDLVLTGWAHIAFMDLSTKGSARIRLTLEESGHPERVVAMDVRPVHRPDVTEAAADGLTNYDWSGFEATVPVTSLAHRGRFRDGHWRLRLEVRSHGVTRRKWLSRTEPGRAKRPPGRTVDGARIVPTSEAGDFAVQVVARPAEVTEAFVDGTVLELRGVLHGHPLDPGAARLRVHRQDGTATLHFPAAAAGPAESGARPFLARLPLDELLTRRGVGDAVAGAEDRADGIVWELSLVTDRAGTRVPLLAAAGLAEPGLLLEAAEVVVRTSRTGALRLLERHVRLEVDEVRWDGGLLVLAGRYRHPDAHPLELVLRDAQRADAHVVPVERDGERATARFSPAAMPTVAGPMALAEGMWQAFVRRAGTRDLLRVKLDRRLLAELPADRPSEADRRLVRVVDDEFDSLAVDSGSELPRHQLGRAGRQRLRSHDYPVFLRRPLAEQVLVDGYGSGQVAADVRAVQEELARRDTGLDVVWSVVDGQAVPPAGARPVARYSQEWYEAVATSRFVVAADLRGVADLDKRPGQRLLQTWHGVPVSPAGLDDRGAGSRLGRGWEERLRREAAQWDVVLATGPAHAALLTRVFGVTNSVAETGLPRHDLLIGADRVAAGSRVRERLGLPPGRRLVLYAPTYRAGRLYRRSGRAGLDRYRFDLELDLDDARAALAPAATLLVRPHPKSVDGAPEADGSEVVDVSRWADEMELVLAADVVVTDHSALVVDAALAGRPVVLWRDEAHAYDRSAGYPDLSGLRVATAQDAMLTAVREALAAPRPTYDELVSTWCPAADGKAAARAVDLLLDGWPG